MTRAPEGQVYLCMACGKRSKTEEGENYGTDTERGWDVSCMMNCVLLSEAAAEAMIPRLP
jgi:hypothetical protein